MKTRHINTFQKGIVSDLDPTLIDNGQWTFETNNFQIFNRAGKGLVATNINGIVEIFGVTDGFTPIGGSSANGILFIVSLKDSVTENPDMEIGCYPSPKSYSVNPNGSILKTGDLGFENVYKPLPNLIDGTTDMIFRTNLLGLKFENRINIITDKNYDDSINIYICDYNVQNLLINCGFNISGALTDGVYNKTELPQVLFQFLTSDTQPALNSVTIRNGGELPTGIMFLYIRYVNQSYDRTAFVKEIGPIQIFNGRHVLDIEGADGEENTNKKLSVVLSNLNTAYEYFEVGVVRYYNSGNAQILDSYLINKFFTITNSVITFELYGTEAQSELDTSELLISSPSMSISKDHIIHENRYLGISWKGRNIDYDLMTALVKKTKIEFDTTEALTDYRLTDFVAAGEDQSVLDPFWYENAQLQYKNYLDTLNKVGFFRGEVYPFGMVVVFTDNSETEPIPCYGVDDIDTAGYDPANGNHGLYRFPMYDTYVDTIMKQINDQTRAMGVKFDLTDFYTEIMSNEGLYKDIAGFYFVRGERIDNLVGQGLMIRCTRGNDADGLSLQAVPYFGNVPIITTDGLGQVAAYSEKAGLTKLEDAFGIFVPDYLFKELDIQNGQDYYVESIFDATNLDSLLTVANHAPDEYANDIHAAAYEAPDDTVQKTGKLFAVPKGVYDFQGGAWRFGTRYLDGTFYLDASSNLEFNRNTDFARFIGFEPDTDILLAESDRWIVNIYKQDPNASSYYSDLVASYDGNLKNVEYFRISPTISIEELKNMTPAQRAGYVCFKGDAFIQRTMFRSEFFRARDSMYDKVEGGIEYEHGMVLSLITENRFNLAMRHDDDGHTYYPKCEVDGINLQTFVHYDGQDQENRLLDEAFFYNEGYHRTLGVPSKFGYDQTTPNRSEEFLQRMWASAKQIPGSFQNSYRILSPSGYKDFDSNYGKMNRIARVLKSIITIQDNSINEHYINERLLSNIGEGNEFVLGVGSVISEKFRRVANYGSQSMSIAVSRNGIYGLDFNKQLIWFAKMTTTKTGQSYVVTDEISNTKLVSNWLKELYESMGYGSSIADEYPDSPVLGEGLVCGYDPFLRKSYFTFLWKDGDVYKSQTLSFNEMFDFFVGTETNQGLNKPGVYMTLNNALISTVGKSSPSSSKVFQHNDKSAPTTMYGDVEDFVLSFIVNGIGEKQQIFEKYFNALEIEMDEIAPTRIDFQTDYQTTTLNPFLSSKFWERPRYKSGKWYIPIPLAVTGENQFNSNSKMYGTWLKVTITFRTTEEVWIRNIITHTNIKQ